MQETCIIIPCYDEAARLDQEAFLHFSMGNPHIFFCFVNDGSKDNTMDILRELALKNEQQFQVLDLKTNSGKGEAVRQGMLKNAVSSSFQFMGYFDADLATPLEEIPKLLSYFANNPSLEIAFGSRKKTKQNSIRRNIFRHNFGRIYAGFVTSVLRLPIYDTQCGAKILTTKTAANVFQKPFLDRWLFDLEVFCRIKKEKGSLFRQSIREVVVETWTETGDSRITFFDILKLPYKTLKLFFRYR